MKVPLVVLPSPVTVGNCAEEIRFALQKARRMDRKLLVIFPLKLLPARIRGKDFDYRIFDLVSPYFLVRPFSPLLLPIRLITSLYFSSLRVLFFARVLAGRPRTGFERTVHHAGWTRIFTPDGQIDSRDWSLALRDRIQEAGRDPLVPSLSPRTRARGEVGRLELGIPEDAWFACLHVREGGFYNDAEASPMRCFDPMTYLEGIRAITSRGGYVVRMGDPSMTPLPAIPGLVDYAHSPVRSGWVDAYLLAEARFFVGTQSGILDVAQLLQRPLLITNMYTPHFGLPHSSGERGLFQVFRDSITGERLQPTDLLSRDRLVSPDFRLTGIECCPNDPKVLRENIELLMDFLDGQIASLPNGLSEDFSFFYWEWLSRGAALDGKQLSQEQLYRLALRGPWGNLPFPDRQDNCRLD